MVGCGLGGVAAALAPLRAGRTVLLPEEYAWLGRCVFPRQRRTGAHVAAPGRMGLPPRRHAGRAAPTAPCRPARTRPRCAGSPRGRHVPLTVSLRRTGRRWG
ncbi:hypothetical protein AB0K12_41605 [Nonomuraea sp. NPDC049419]|uniref:hypothetical protein n=1 Tax=Nonomuraea sp. NPDC049419 TaxID=3155772 RepID=UPI003419388E